MFSMFALLSPRARCAEFVDAHLGKGLTISITDDAKRTKKIGTGRRPREISISPDRITVAWISVDGGTETLNLYRNNKRRMIKCDQLIRSYWFVARGKRIAMDCGGEHFAGIESLFDTETLSEIEKVDQSKTPYEKRPSWSKDED